MKTARYNDKLPLYLVIQLAFGVASPMSDICRASPKVTENDINWGSEGDDRSKERRIGRSFNRTAYSGALKRSKLEGVQMVILRKLVPAMIIALTALSCPSMAPAEEPPELANSLFKVVNPVLKTPKDVEDYLVNNMHKVQNAAEAYATRHSGKYPTKIDDAFKSYFGMGEHDDKTYNAWSSPYDPFLKKRNWMTLGKVSDINKTRQSPPGKLKAGTLEYSPINNGQDYAIRVGGSGDKAVSEKAIGKSAQRTLVFSSDPALAVIASMKSLQLCLESYAEEHEGEFPKKFDDTFKIFLPGGDTIKKTPGRLFFNPITKKEEWPVVGHLTDLFPSRHKAPEPMPPGRLEYSCIMGGRNYAIRGGGPDGKAVPGIFGPKSTMVIGKDADGAGHE